VLAPVWKRGNPQAAGLGADAQGGGRVFALASRGHLRGRSTSAVSGVAVAWAFAGGHQRDRFAELDDRRARRASNGTGRWELTGAVGTSYAPQRRRCHARLKHPRQVEDWVRLFLSFGYVISVDPEVRFSGGSGTGVSPVCRLPRFARADARATTTCRTHFLLGLRFPRFASSVLVQRSSNVEPRMLANARPDVTSQLRQPRCKLPCTQESARSEKNRPRARQTGGLPWTGAARKSARRRPGDIVTATNSSRRTVDDSVCAALSDGQQAQRGSRREPVMAHNDDWADLRRRKHIIRFRERMLNVLSRPAELYVMDRRAPCH